MHADYEPCLLLLVIWYVCSRDFKPILLLAFEPRHSEIKCGWLLLISFEMLNCDIMQVSFPISTACGKIIVEVWEESYWPSQPLKPCF
jgi:hypothetical protein